MDAVPSAPELFPRGPWHPDHWHSPVIITHSGGSVIASVTVTIRCHFFSSCPVRVSGQSTCRHVGLDLSKAYYCPASILTFHD